MDINSKKTSGNAFDMTNLIGSMLIFGTVGIVVRNVALPSAFAAMVRGYLGALVLLLVIFASKRRPDMKAIKNNALLLVLSGVFIGINWILLFESYRFTTVATATLCYYMAPVFVVTASPFVLKARVAPLKWVCVILAVLGMVFVSEPWSMGIGNGGAVGILLALGAAFFYACVTLLNKKMRNISSYDTTVVQLLSASTVIIPYVLLVDDITAEMFDPTSVILLAVLGVVHTGFAYTMFFGSVKALPADTVAIFSYIDPIVAVLLSALFLREPMTLFGIVGAVLIVASTLISELYHPKS